MLRSEMIPLAFNPGTYSTCDICQLPFCLLPIHKKVHHRNGRENKCAFCGTPFSSVQALTDHLDSHSDTDLFCCMCLLPYFTDESLAEHLEGHRELHVLACSKCSRTFASKACLLSHECEGVESTVVKREAQEDHSSRAPATDYVKKSRGKRLIIRQTRICSFSAATDTGTAIIISSPDLKIGETMTLVKTEPTIDAVESVDVPNGLVEMSPSNIPPPREAVQEAAVVEESIPQPEAPHEEYADPENVNSIDQPEVTPDAGSNALHNVEPSTTARVAGVPSGIVLPDSPPTESVSQLADDGRSPVQNDSDNTADVSSVVLPKAPKVEPVDDGERNNACPEDVPQFHPRRSTRKRALVEVPNDVQRIQPNEVIIVSASSVHQPLGLPGSTEPTPPDSPVPPKRGKLTFCERIECWNPILKERTWREISDEVREVSLLAPPPKRKRSQKKSPRTKKRKKVLATLDRIKEEENAPWLQELDGISVPTALVPPTNLRPVLKPPGSSSEPQEKTSVRVENRGAVMKNAALLYERYGKDFDYNKCAKVDGRYHCPEPDCTDNKHRGYGGVKGLREHIRMRHIDASLFNCPKCSRVFPTKSKLKEHIIVHSSSRPYLCIKCGNYFKTPYLLTQHEGTHEKLMQCYHCEKGFSSKRGVVFHLRASPMRCKCCKLSFRCPSLFRQHESEIKHSYECSLCGSQSSTRASFDRHVRDAHYDSTTEIDGSFLCHICCRKFTTRHNALRHLRRSHETYLSQLNDSEEAH